MNQIKKLKQYCETMLLDCSFEDESILIGEKTYLIITNDDLRLFDEEMNFLPAFDSDYELDGEDGFVYEFGGRWYIQEYDSSDIDLTELKYINQAKQQIPTNSFLGIRSGYELMNGMGLYEEWVKKAKFLGIKALGICEKKTLSGALVFQTECERNGIKSIIGLTIPMSNGSDIKLYAKTFQGWLELLKFNTLLNVDEKHQIDEDFLLENSDDLFIVLDPKSVEFGQLSLSLHQRADFYQLDTVNFLNEDIDKDYIDNLEKFILSDLEPISITDAFYLEADDYQTREIMWAVAKAFDDKTDNQYFKNKDQYATELISMFDSECKSWVKLFKKANANEALLVEGCNFKYDTDTRHLPKYIMTEEEADEFENNDALFLHLIQKGFKEKAFKDPQKYINRLKAEIKVLKQGDVIDYFLGLYDIVRYAKSEKLLTGIGRGSAGGSLIAYLMGIIQIDPLEFDLLFERFLNSGRMGEYQDRPFYTITTDDGQEIGLAEGSLIRVKRDNKEKVIFIQELVEGDEIIKY